MEDDTQEQEIEINVWEGTGSSSVGNWGHLSLTTPGGRYLSIWPKRAVVPGSPKGSVVPVPATLSSNQRQDELAEADLANKQPLTEDGDDHSLPDSYPPVEIEPKKADKTYKLPVSEAELAMVEANVDAIKGDVEAGKLAYCAYDLLSKDCVNCIVGVKLALKGTRHQDEFPCGDGMLPGKCAKLLENYVSNIRDDAGEYGSTPGP